MPCGRKPIPTRPGGRWPVRTSSTRARRSTPGKGPGLGCFWFQVIVLGVVVFLTPLSAAWDWPVPVTIVLLALTLVLLLFVGQTIIFLLRLVAADRRADARRRPLRSGTKTVGEMEDEAASARADEEADRRGGSRPPRGRRAVRGGGRGACENSAGPIEKDRLEDRAPCPCSRPTSPFDVAATRSSSST